MPPQIVSSDFVTKCNRIVTYSRRDVKCFSGVSENFMKFFLRFCAAARGRTRCARSLPPSFASQMPPPSSEGGFFPWPPLTRGLSSAARLGERSPRFPCGARPPGRAGPSPWGEAMMGSPPKPSGDSRGFGGERRSSEMSELSPLGGSERYGACDDEGAAPCGRPVSPSVICFANATSLVRGRLFLRAAEGGGPYGATTARIRCRGGLWPPAGAQCAPLRKYAFVGRALLDAPDLPPGGKVARRTG